MTATNQVTPTILNRTPINRNPPPGGNWDPMPGVSADSWLPVFSADPMAPLASLSVCHVNLQGGCDLARDVKSLAYNKFWRNRVAVRRQTATDRRYQPGSMRCTTAAQRARLQSLSSSNMIPDRLGVVNSDVASCEYR